MEEQKEVAKNMLNKKGSSVDLLSTGNKMSVMSAFQTNYMFSIFKVEK